MNKAITIAPWELARREGKTIIQRILGPMVGVYYPYRKGGDLYALAQDGPNQVAHCCQDGCDCDIPIAEFINHVNSHNRRFKRYPNLIIDKSLVAPGIKLPKYKSTKGRNC